MLESGILEAPKMASVWNPFEVQVARNTKKRAENEQIHGLSPASALAGSISSFAAGAWSASTNASISHESEPQSSASGGLRFQDKIERSTFETHAFVTHNITPRSGTELKIGRSDVGIISSTRVPAASVQSSFDLHWQKCVLHSSNVLEAEKLNFLTSTAKSLLARGNWPKSEVFVQSILEILMKHDRETEEATRERVYWMGRLLASRCHQAKWNAALTTLNSPVKNGATFGDLIELGVVSELTSAHIEYVKARCFHQTGDTVSAHRHCRKAIKIGRSENDYLGRGLEPSFQLILGLLSSDEEVIGIEFYKSMIPLEMEEKKKNLSRWNLELGQDLEHGQNFKEIRERTEGAIRKATKHAIEHDDLALADILFNDPHLVKFGFKDELGDGNGSMFDGEMPLEMAVRHGSVKMVNLLLDKGATVRSAIPNKTRELIQSAVSGSHQRSREILELLLKHGLPVDGLDAQSNPLSLALATRKNRDVIELLISYGANVHHTLSDGNTFLMLASETNWDLHGEMPFQSFVAAGVDINAQDIRGRTALHRAVLSKPGLDGGDASQHVATMRKVQVLLDLGADASIKDYLGRTARKCARTRMIRQLLLQAESSGGKIKFLGQLWP